MQDFELQDCSNNNNKPTSSPYLLYILYSTCESVWTTLLLKNSPLQMIDKVILVL